MPGRVLERMFSADGTGAGAGTKVSDSVSGALLALGVLGALTATGATKAALPPGTVNSPRPARRAVSAVSHVGHLRPGVLSRTSRITARLMTRGMLPPK